MAFGERTETLEVLPRGLRISRLRWHRHQSACVKELEEARQAVGLDAGLRRLADAVHDLHLVRLQVADEVPAERVAVLGVLALELLGAILPDDVDPRLCQDRHVGDRYVLRGRDNRDALPHLAADARVVLAYALRRRSR